MSRASCRNRRGLTMAELIVVLAVMAVLAGVALPVTIHQVGKAKVSSTRHEIADLAESIRAYAKDVGYDPAQVRWGRFPAEAPGAGRYRTILGTDLEENLTGSGWNAALRRGWNGPYVSSERTQTDPDGRGTESAIEAYRVDGWGRYYVYMNRNATGGRVRLTDSERVVTLTSGGPDRDPRTDDDNINVIVYRGPIY